MDKKKHESLPRHGGNSCDLLREAALLRNTARLYASGGIKGQSKFDA